MNEYMVAFIILLAAFIITQSILTELNKDDSEQEEDE